MTLFPQTARRRFIEAGLGAGAVRVYNQPFMQT
jgi:hypothetical protein